MLAEPESSPILVRAHAVQPIAAECCLVCVPKQLVPSLHLQFQVCRMLLQAFILCRPVKDALSAAPLDRHAPDFDSGASGRFEAVLYRLEGRPVAQICDFTERYSPSEVNAQGYEVSIRVKNRQQVTNPFSR